MVRRILLLGAACSLVLLVACAPKPHISLTEQACLEAAAAESSATAGVQRAELAKSGISEKEAHLVELQRLRSQIVTRKISDEDLVAYQLEPKKPEPAPTTVVQDTTGATGKAVSDTTAAATKPDTTMTSTAPDTTTAAGASKQATPSDSTAVQAAPSDSSAVHTPAPTPADTTGNVQQAPAQSDSAGTQAAPAPTPKQQNQETNPQGAPSAGGGTNAPAPQSSP